MSGFFGKDEKLVGWWPYAKDRALCKSPGVQKQWLSSLLFLSRKVVEKRAALLLGCSQDWVVCGVMRSLPCELPVTWLQGMHFSLFTL